MDWGGILAVALGIYQANLSFAVLLSIFVIIKETLKNERNGIDDIKYGLRFVMASIIGIILYYGILYFLLVFFGQTLVEYQGANESLAINLNTVLKIIEEFKNCFIMITGGDNVIMALLVIVVFIYLLIMIVLNMVQKKSYRNYIKVAIILASILIAPFVTGYAYFISENTIYHMVMRMAWVLFFIGALAINEDIINNKKSKSLQITCKYLLRIILGIIIYNNIVVANISYLNMHQRYEKEYAFSSRLINKLESQEQYNNQTPVILVGNRSNDSVENLYNKKIKYITGAEGNILLPSDFHIKQFIRYYLGVDLKSPDSDKWELINNSGLIENMEVFPNSGCIEIIEDVFVIKIGN